MYVIGLSSGTSVDGIDAALTEVTGRGSRAKIRLITYRTLAYPRGVRERVLALQSDSTDTLVELCRLNAYLGELFADAAIKLAKAAGVPLRRVGLIGSHGQTVAHQPAPVREGRFRVAGTLQIGEPSVIAERTGVTTVADFRPRDLAAGGQGAPLTALIHHRCFAHARRDRLVVNLGGITNVTWIPAGHVADPSAITAFDTGPGNMLIDGLADRFTRGRETMDRGGRMAASGAVHDRLLASLLTHPFLAKRPPKTTGRETFGRALADRVAADARRLRVAPRDVMATVTAFTARTIADAHARFLRSRARNPALDVIVGGGGVFNATLMAELRRAFPRAGVESMAAHGVDPKAIEAMAFALLAYLTFHREPDNVPSATGANRAVVLGKIIPK
ncbi:MAG TPA: anhydro-N-acetylmuramic acid kinase [Nitrospiria bacterium]|nr:anhydro-N-acetylmuramic acid kinase [Nitrospiria bacterium]